MNVGSSKKSFVCVVSFVAISALAACAAQVRASVVPPSPVQPTDYEGAAHGFPSLRNLQGARLADGEFLQWLDGESLHTVIRYDFGESHVIEEQDVVEQRPELVQTSWSWREERDGSIERRFEIDFRTGIAIAQKRDGPDLKQWSKKLELEPGRAFAGSAFTLALKSLRSRLLRGESIELQTVGFTPEPRLAKVSVSHAGVDRIAMSDREIEGDRFVIHPEIPAIVKLFVKVPDTQLWLVSSEPTAFLRWEGPLAEPDDRIVRVDLLPGETSGRAAPVER